MMHRLLETGESFLLQSANYPRGTGALRRTAKRSKGTKASERNVQTAKKELEPLRNIREPLSNDSWTSEDKFKGPAARKVQDLGFRV